MEKVRCQNCGKRVPLSKAYRINRYDMAYRYLDNPLPVQTICEDCLGHLSDKAEETEK